MEMHEIVSAMEKKGRAAVLATIIDVEGHAYRKQGVSMVLWDDGSSLGHLSPGCMEADLAEHAQQMFKVEGAKVIDYDMRPADDLSWGEAIGCGGQLRILLESVGEGLQACLSELKRTLDGGQSVILERIMTPDAYDSVAAYRLLSSGENEVLGVWSRKGSFVDPLADPLESVAGTLRFTYHVKPRLVIFGAGPDAVPVANGALKAGFSVTVADWRQVLCASDVFADDVERILGFPKDIMPQLELGAHDYVIIMSHQLQRDKQFLELVWEAPLAYLGILGSISRTEQLLDGRNPPQWFHAPIGLDIGAQGAEEIAISIVAELIQARRSPIGRQVRGARREAHGTNYSRYLFGRREKPSYGIR